jgi:hypothetical protein
LVIISSSSSIIVDSHSHRAAGNANIQQRGASRRAGIGNTPTRRSGRPGSQSHRTARVGSRSCDLTRRLFPTRMCISGISIGRHCRLGAFQRSSSIPSMNCSLLVT